MLEEWAESVGLTLGPLIPTEAARHQVLCLFYHYRHLNGTDLKDLPATDLITHRVRIKPGTKPASNTVQKRWPAHTEWWLRKIINDGIEGGVYELSQPANGRLSQWNARAVIVDKVENPKPEDEPRVTFDYSRVHEDLPGTYLELSSKVHDNLSNPRHKCLFAADLKHAYLTIPLHPADRHYFAFTISGIGQVQPTRMQQGSKSAGFTMTELVYRAFGALPPPIKEPSLLHSGNPNDLPVLVFYMDDFFGGFEGFEELYDFLRYHFLPRVEWARLRLSFKKLRLFVAQLTALGVTHCVGGLVRILEERVARIARWPVPSDQSGVRGFLGAVGITRRWIKNFAELSRPLTRLTGKVDWRWTASEQLSFEIIRIKSASRVGMHGLDLRLAVHFYVDASGFGAGLAITQFQDPGSADTTGTKAVEVPIVYDSFIFAPTRRKYPIYKRELYALVTFVTKYDYLCKHPYLPAVIHTDHKPLTHFLSSDLHEGIYGHWADQLRRLNVSIQYIPGPRNKVADALSRTLFQQEDCSVDPIVASTQEQLAAHGSHWIWKDGKGGFEEYLKSLSPTHQAEVRQHCTIDGLSVFAITATVADDSWKESYESSAWFGDTYKFLRGELQNPLPNTLRKALDYRLEGEILWIHRGENYLPCIPELKVLSVLKEVHDQSGHWAKTGTIARLRGRCYWPGQSQDVERYIAGCLDCARHGPATRSQPLHPVRITFPFQLMGMDFVGPLERTASGMTYILVLVCYMSRFTIPFACKNANVEDVIWCLKLFFVMYRRPYAFYCDPGHHFFNEELREYLRGEGVAIDYRPSGASKSTGMVEVCNRLLEDVLRKDSQTHLEWDQRIPKSAGCVNTRTIAHLGFSPTSILFGDLLETSAMTATLLALPGRDIHAWAEELDNPISHARTIQEYLTHRAEVHDLVTEASNRRKDDEAARYNRGVRQVTHHLQDLVMVHQDKSRKLEARWRGPFRISDYGGTHGRSFRLQQLNGRKVRGTYHGDHLKPFIPRTGYLADSSTPSLPPQQTIRKRRLRGNLHQADPDVLH